MKKALFAGTFDPPSYGHLDLIKRAQTTCDRLYVAIATNKVKRSNALFSTEEIMALMHEITHELPYVEVVSFSGLVVEFAKKNQVDFLIRGLRAYSDFEYEFRMALANRKISGIETLFLMADEKHAYISSTLIRELGSYQCRLKEFIPPAIEERVFQRIQEKITQR